VVRRQGLVPPQHFDRDGSPVKGQGPGLRAEERGFEQQGVGTSPEIVERGAIRGGELGGAGSADDDRLHALASENRPDAVAHPTGPALVVVSILSPFFGPARHCASLTDRVAQVDLTEPHPYSRRMDYRERITIEPDKLGGKPCIRGLRITVYDVLDYLASGMSQEEILRDFPDLTPEDIRACLAFAAERERRLMALPPA
jgi:uncharacterized protein (DUF433 family)